MRHVILAVALAAACSDGGAQQAPAQLTGPAFSGDSAFVLLQKQVAFGPRFAGAPGHQAQLDWMLEYLRARADSVEVQPFEHTTEDGATVRMSNVFARFKPEAATRVLLLAHWDTRPRADKDPDPAKYDQPIPGANDGASGVAVLLELANVLFSHSPSIGVDLLFTDGEDFGPNSEDMYLGANHFAANLPRAYKPLYGILLDMVGDRNPVFPQEGNSLEHAPEVVERVWRLAEEIGYSQYFPRRTGGYITDDHLPLNRAGIRTIDIIDFDYPHWHRSTDDVENTSPVGLGAVGTVLVELIWREGAPGR